jgi:hypothetical protein
MSPALALCAATAPSLAAGADEVVPMPIFDIDSTAAPAAARVAVRHLRIRCACPYRLFDADDCSAALPFLAPAPSRRG